MFYFKNFTQFILVILFHSLYLQSFDYIHGIINFKFLNILLHVKYLNFQFLSLIIHFNLKFQLILLFFDKDIIIILHILYFPFINFQNFQLIRQYWQKWNQKDLLIVFTINRIPILN